MPIVTLKPGTVRPIWTGHPWVFAQAIARIEGGAVAGDEVTVVDPHGAVLGRGLYTPRSAIPVRMFTHDNTPIDGALFRRRIERAIAHRRDLGLPSAAPGHETDAYRLIYAEGDGLPGLTVDIFADVAVVQLNTVGVKQREGIIFDALISALSPRAIVDRTPTAIAQLEGFEASSGVVRGDTTVESLRFAERGLRYEIPLTLGQKTGFYLDQRPLRARVEQLARGRRVLDVHAFVGAFSMAAARGGAAEVIAVDESAVAIEVGAECARQNKLEGRIQFVREDARQALQQASRRGGYDLVICDPPKLAPSRGAKEGALNVYKSLAAAACRATKPGGILVFCSCSSAVGLDDLTRALALGARDARMQAAVFDRHFLGGDHPVPAAFPEGLYLKSVIARVEALCEPLSALSKDEARALRGLIFDLDDTLLDHGALTEPAYSALFRLREAGLRLIACTGRPAGWGEVIQRQWPIDATVVENGALSLVATASEGAARRITALASAEAGVAGRASLLRLAESLAAQFPDTALADDNAARVTDVTLDIGEHRCVPAHIVAAMRRIASEHGVRTVASSVHLHLTYEAEDKASGAIGLLCRHFGEDATAARGRYAFVGDSNNDAAPFAAFLVTFGVSNIRGAVRSLSVPPRFVSDAPMGRGFAEIAARLGECREKSSV